MIKMENKSNHASLAEIYGEIINLSSSIGECKSSIDHNESLLYRIHSDLKLSLDKISDRLIKLEESEIIRRNRSKFLWNLINVSPTNIFKWISIIVLVGSISGTIAKINFNQEIIKLIKFATG